jgi:hypothetical protein
MVLRVWARPPYTPAFRSSERMLSAHKLYLEAISAAHGKITAGSSIYDAV